MFQNTGAGVFVDDQVMYKIKKQTKRTSKQLFAILKDKLLELARSQPKIKVAQLSHQKIIFPEQLKFPAPNPEEMADQSVTLADLKDHPTAKYEFYLQSYQININDELLSLLRPQCIYSIPQQHANGRPSCIAANSKGVVAVGFDSGKVAIVNDLANKAFEVLQASTQTILCLDINETCLLCCDAVGHCSYFQLLLPTSKPKLICQFQTAPSIVCKLLNDQMALICDLEGGISRVKIKKWMLIYRVEVKLLIRDKCFFQMLRVLDRKLQIKYLNKQEYGQLTFFAAISQRFAILFSYNPNNDRIDKLYTLSNPTLIADRGSNSLEFLTGPISNTVEDCLALACGFDDRIYFVTIELADSEIVLEDHVQIKSRFEFRQSKRMKCTNSIVAINLLHNGLFTMVTKTGTIFYCYTKNIIFLERFTNIGELKKLSLDYKQDVHGLTIPDGLPALKGIHLYCGSTCIINGHLLIITSKEITLCEVLDSLAVHSRLCITENILLLCYLLLLRLSPSPYLTPLQDFTGMELEFPRSSRESKQILLEYYYLMDMEPPEDFATEDELNELLLPFILRHQLSNLSDQQTDALVRYWEKKNYLVIEEIIMSGINKGWDIAIKNAWMRSLVKMVQMGAEYDFPVLKLYGYVVLYKDTDRQLMEKYAVRIINYILLGLRHKLKPNADHEEYIGMVQLFVRVLFDRDLLDVLVSVKPKKAMIMITQLLSGQSKQCVDEIGLCPFIVNCNRKYEDLSIMEGSVSEILYSHACQTVMQMYPEDKQVQNCVVLQQAFQIHGWDFRFTEERVFKVISCLLSSDEIFQKLKAHPMFAGKVKQELELAAQQFIIDLIDNMASNYCIKEQQKWTFVELADKSSAFDYVTINLLSSTKKFESVFAKFLSSRNSLVRERIFDWMIDTMEKCQRNPDPKVLDEFNRVSLSKVRYYMQINKEKTKAFVQQYYKNSEKKLISRIEEYPQLQLQYVELIIQDSTEEVEQYILNLHISLLCRLNPSRVIPVLEEYSTHQFVTYNLKEALELCIEHKLTEAAIYINEKVGDVYMSLGRHLEVFADQWEKYKKDKREKKAANSIRRTVTLDDFRNLLNRQKTTNEESKNSEEVLYDHLDYMLDLIHKQPKLPSYYQLYGLIVNYFMKLYTTEEEQSRSVVNRGDETFLNKASDLIGILILDLARQGNIDYLVDQVIDKYVNMDFREMRKHFSFTYKVLQQTLMMLKKVSDVSKRHLLRFNIITRQEMVSSIPSESHCGLCSGLLTDQSEALLFNCGHIFHMDCTICQDENDYCAQCVYTNPVGALVNDPQLNLNKFLGERAARLRQNRQQQQQLAQKQSQAKKLTLNQKRMNKMKIYDKRQQQLILQAETIELRLELQQTIE